MKIAVPTAATAGTTIAPMPVSTARMPATVSSPRERDRSSGATFTQLA